MTNEEAKFILGAVRPEQINPSDPDVAEALRLAGSDPELGAWFARSSAFDAVVADRLRGIEPPADLKDNILAGVRVSRRPVRRFRLGPVLLAAAALVALSLVGIRFLPMTPKSSAPPAISDQGQLARFRSDMLREIECLQKIDFVSNDPDSVTAWLKENGASPDFDIPSVTGGHTLVGCKVIHWKGHRVSLVCFTNPDASGPPALHLLTLAADAMPGLGESAEEFHRENDWTTSAWREGGRIHLLVAKGKHPDLRQRLPLG